MRPRFTVPSMHVWRTQHTTERETHIDTTCTKLVSNCNSKPYWRLVLPTTQAARRPHSAGIPPEVNRERVWSSLTGVQRLVSLESRGVRLRLIGSR